MVTNGCHSRSVSRKVAARDDGWATTVLRMEQAGMVGAHATGGGSTWVDMRGRRFSFPLKLLLLMNVDFFLVLGVGIPPPLAFLGEALSTREKVSIVVKVKVVDIDAGRLDGCRAGALPLLLLRVLYPSLEQRGRGRLSIQASSLLALEKTLISDLRRCERSGILYFETGLSTSGLGLVHER